MPTTKTCTKCGETKPLDGFYKAEGCKYGVRPTCKPCIAEQRRRYREANRDKIAERNRRYREANRDNIRELNRRHYEKNRDKLLEYQRRYQAENRDKIAERERRYREANRDKIAERERRYREANRDDIAECQRRYREANRDDIAECQRRYREANRDIRNVKLSKHRREAQELTEMFATSPKRAPWMPEEVTFLLADNGMTTYQKAVKLGRTYASCTGKLAHLRKKLTA